ncbi:MAG: gliding motility protein GldL [Bacteroidales bacterium]|nr:gliding motility protein GldL [Bacteroidales bacterium]MCM1147242.1 gliding motility protein GldL [Bacteroidales bacterium]MCM1207209.1 gliding motility protein GldL [Bacillota bacterium]MCM1509727.1 gliding motility protein GldL [Clostridium sp.]
MAKYSKFNIVYLLQKWMDSVAGQTFMNYAYSWGASVVILGTLFKLTHLPGANIMLFLGMGTEVFVFFIAAFDRPFDKTSEGRHLATDSQLAEQLAKGEEDDEEENADDAPSEVAGGTVIFGGGVVGGTVTEQPLSAEPSAVGQQTGMTPAIVGEVTAGAPAPAVSRETAEAMEEATTTYVDRLNELNGLLLKVGAQSERLTTDSEEMENLNRTLTGIARVYEMQLKSASQQITTQDEINDQTRRLAQQIADLNAIYARMIEAMSVNMNVQAK